MTITLHNLQPKKGSKKLKKRVGRGLGSTGTTAGRGQKGQKSRSGVGGLKRLGMKKTVLSTPKLRGFKSPHAKKGVINLSAIEKSFKAGDVLTPKKIEKSGLVREAKDGVKILGNGEITIAVKVQGCLVSKSAAEKILKAGGEIVA